MTTETVERRTWPWVLAGLAVALMIAADIVGDPSGDPSVGTVDAYLLLLTFASFPFIGALIASRYPGNPLGWMILGAGVIVGLGVLGTAGSTRHFTEGIDTPLASWAAWVADWYWYPGFALLTNFLVLLFPTGKPVSRRWGWVVWATGGVIVAITSLYMVSDRLRVGNRFVDSPIGLLERRIADRVATPLFFALAALSFLAVASLLARFRRSRGQERLQLKWLLFATSLFLFCAVLGDAVGLPTALFSVLFLTLPGAVAIAMLRYRLYDIDIVINRAVVYSVLTAVLAGFYVVIVFALQRLSAPFTAESDLAIAGSTLVVAGLFRPIRSRVQTFIDLRFYRRKFDTQQTLDEFSNHLRDEVDLTSLTSRLTSVVADTMQPAHVSLWIRTGAPR